MNISDILPTNNSSPHELSTPVADNVYLEKIYMKICLHLRIDYGGPGVRNLTDLKSVGFRSRLEASCASIHTEDL